MKNTKNTKNMKNTKNTKRKKTQKSFLRNTDKKNEKNLACYLANHTKIQVFAIHIFYFMLQYWNTYYPEKWLQWVRPCILEKVNGNVIQSIGFTPQEIKNVLEYTEKKDLKAFTKYLVGMFYKVTASINNLSKPDFTFYHVDIHKDLQTLFLKELQRLFFIENITWKDIQNLFFSLKSPVDKTQFHFFLFDLLYSSNSKVHSIYRINLSYMDFFREKWRETHHTERNFIKLNQCNKSITERENYQDYGIYDATEKYRISPNNPYAKIMKFENSSYISGPSGSTSILYISLFHLYHYPFTYKNKVLLLGTLIADYIPLWHTLPEILLSAIPEFQTNKIPSYRLDKNPLSYCLRILKPFL
jgi:hypothetical protein